MVFDPGIYVLQPLEPIGLVVEFTTMKAFLKLPGDQEQTTIESMIKTAVGIAETVLNRAICNRQYRLSYHQIPRENDIIPLRLGNISGIDRVYIIDEDQTETDQAEKCDYHLDGDSPELWLKPFNTWTPSTRKRYAFHIEYHAGYSIQPENTIPEPVLHAIKRVTAYLYSNRGVSVKPGTPEWEKVAGIILESGYRRY